MKKFETLTDIEILNAAWLYYLNREQREEERYRQAPTSELAKYRYEREKAREEELYEELVRLENANHS